MTRSRKAQPHRRRATFSLVALSLALLTFAPQALAAPKITVATLGTSASGTTGGLFSGARAIAVNSTGAGGVPAHRLLPRRLGLGRQHPGRRQRL